MSTSGELTSLLQGDKEEHRSPNLAHCGPGQLDW